MSLYDYLVEMVTPGRRIKSGKHLWDRRKDSILDRKEISDVINAIEDPNQKDAAIKTLSQKVNDQYELQGKEYFSRGPNLARYGALGLSLVGGLTAAGAMLAIAAGGPLTAIAAMTTGLMTVGYGGILGTIADVYDSKKSQEAIGGKLQPSKKVGYLKKLAGKTWDVLNTPINKETYKSLYNNFPQLAEGLIWRSLTYFGPSYIGAATGPIGGIASLGGSYIDFYRGRKKFDDKVIGSIEDKGVEEFLRLYGKSKIRPIDEKSVGSQKPILVKDYPYAVSPGYGLTQINNPNKISYIEPRKKAA